MTNITANLALDLSASALAEADTVGDGVSLGLSVPVTAPMATPAADSLKVFDRVVPKPALDRTVRRMYRTHKYWARKPWYVVAQYIEFFTQPGDRVLDVFGGSGVTGLEAVALDREAHIVDLNPMATFISDTAALSVELDQLMGAFLTIKDKLELRLDGLYATQQPCPRCGTTLVGRHFLRGPVFEVFKVKEDCRACGYVSRESRPLTPAEQEDIESIENREIHAWYPKKKFPDAFDKNRVTYKGIRYIHQIFTRRNLLALSALFAEINGSKDKTIRKMLRLVFSNTLLHVSKLKAENVRPMAVNNYWIPDDWMEENVWFRFAERFALVLEAKKVSNARIGCGRSRNLHTYTQSSKDLGFLESGSIDYCFNDPPYGDSIQYSELSMVWNAWLGTSYKNASEVIINRFQGKQVDDYQALLTAVYREVFRVLKQGGYMTVCFHNKDVRVWSAILKSCKDAGFLYVNAVPQRPISKSFTQAWAENSPKSDMLMNFVKPDGDAALVPHAFIRAGGTGRVIADVIKGLESKKIPLNLGTVYDNVLSRLVGHSFYADEALNAADFSLSKVKSVLESHASS